MMPSIKAETQEISVIEQVVMQGDLSKLNPQQRVEYYNEVCKSLGLNPFTRPFDYIVLNGKLTLYAKKDATEQLRKLNGISIDELEGKIIDDLYVVTAKARTKDGRIDQATGAVNIGHLKGEQKANALMKAETKAKRRVTLSISGMGWSDETEVESIPGAKAVHVDLETGEMGAPKITVEQADELAKILDECSPEYLNKFFEFITQQYGKRDLTAIPANMFDKFRKSAIQNRGETLAAKMLEAKAIEA